jgi:hypothetical protein
MDFETASGRRFGSNSLVPVGSGFSRIWRRATRFLPRTLSVPVRNTGMGTPAKLRLKPTREDLAPLRWCPGCCLASLREAGHLLRPLAKT